MERTSSSSPAGVLPISFLLLTVLFAVLFTPVPARAADLIVVGVSVNGEPKGDAFAVRTDDGDFLLKIGDLAALGLPGARGTILTVQNEQYLSLRAVQGLTYSFNEKSLTLAITAQPTLLGKTVIDLTVQPKAPAAPPGREISAFLNYGVSYAGGSSDGFQAFSIADTFGVRQANLLFLTDSLYTKTPDIDRFVRLMSSVTYEQRGYLRWFVAGDQFASSGELGSSINVGGLGMSKIYRMDPYFIRQPTLDMTGTASFPSQAEIYLDGMLVDRKQIIPGEFELKDFNYYGGAHSVELRIRDPFGNIERFFYPSYFTDALLGKGLHEYNYAVGFLREQYGMTSNDYGKPALSVYHRYGVTDSLTLGGRAEATQGVWNAGALGAVLLPSAGVVSASIAGSGNSGQQGSAAGLTHTYQKMRFNTHLFLRHYSREYAAVSPVFTEKPHTEAGVGAGIAFPRYGTFSLNYAAADRYDGLSRKITSASYSRNLSRDSTLSVTLSSARGEQPGIEAFVMFNYYPGKNVQVSALYQHSRETDTEILEIQKNTPIGEGYGYRADLARSDSDTVSSTSFAPFFQYNAGFGTYSIDARMQQINGDGSGSYTATAAGALVYAGGLFGVTRPVNDTFGIIQVDRLPGVIVKVNNEEIGKTDSSGRLIIPTLKSYYQNQVSLDPADIPMDYRLSDVKADISPSPWGGACIAFEAERIQAVTGRLFAGAGTARKPLEFREVTLEAGKKEITFPTGRGGEFYFETVIGVPEENVEPGFRKCRSFKRPEAPAKTVIKPGKYAAWTDYEGTRCAFEIFIPISGDVIIDVGEITCSAL